MKQYCANITIQVLFMINKFELNELVEVELFKFLFKNE